MNFRGITWFQGESNGNEAARYACLQIELVRQWKRDFSPDGATEAAGPWFGFVVLEPFSECRVSAGGSTASRACCRRRRRGRSGRQRRARHAHALLTSAMRAARHCVGL